MAHRAQRGGRPSTPAPRNPAPPTTPSRGAQRRRGENSPSWRQSRHCRADPVDSVVSCSVCPRPVLLHALLTVRTSRGLASLQHFQCSANTRLAVSMHTYPKTARGLYNPFRQSTSLPTIHESHTAVTHACRGPGSAKHSRQEPKVSPRAASHCVHRSPTFTTFTTPLHNHFCSSSHFSTASTLILCFADMGTITHGLSVM